MDEIKDVKPGPSDVRMSDADQNGEVEPRLKFASAENDDVSSPDSEPSISKSTEDKTVLRDDSGVCDDDDDMCDNPDSSSKIKQKKFKSIGTSLNSYNSDPSSPGDSGLQESSNNSTDLMPPDLDDDDDNLNTNYTLDITNPDSSVLDPTRRNRILDDDSCSSDFSTSDNEECDDDAASDSKIFDSVKDKVLLEFLSDKTVKHRHSWNMAKELSTREYGITNRCRRDVFKHRFHGSRHVVERLELMYKMESHRGCVNSLNFNSTGTLLVSGSDDLNLIIWDWTIGEPLLKFPSGHDGNVFQSVFLPMSGDCHIVSCSRDGQVRLAELSSIGRCKGTRRVAQHAGNAHKLTVRPDFSQVVLSCGEDAVVFEIDLRESKPHKLLTCKENSSKVPLYALHSNPYNPNEFIIGGRDPFVRMYDCRFIKNENVVKKFCPNHLLSGLNKKYDANVICCVYNYNGREVLASYDEDIYLFDALHSYEDGAVNYSKKYQGHRNNKTVKGVNFFGPENQYIVSGSDCGNIYYWDKATTRLVQCMMGDEGGVVNCLEPHPNIPVIATGGLDDDIKIWIPSNENAPDLTPFKRVIRRNRRIREDKNSKKVHIDSRMIWLILRRLHRHSTSSQHDSPDAAEMDDLSDNNDDSDSDGPSSSQCVQS